MSRNRRQAPMRANPSPSFGFWVSCLLAISLSGLLSFALFPQLSAQVVRAAYSSPPKGAPWDPAKPIVSRIRRTTQGDANEVFTVELVLTSRVERTPDNKLQYVYRFKNEGTVPVRIEWDVLTSSKFKRPVPSWPHKYANPGVEHGDIRLDADTQPTISEFKVTLFVNDKNVGTGSSFAYIPQ